MSSLWAHTGAIECIVLYQLLATAVTTTPNSLLDRLLPLLSLLHSDILINPIFVVSNDMAEILRLSLPISQQIRRSSYIVPE